MPTVIEEICFASQTTIANIPAQDRKMVFFDHLFGICLGHNSKRSTAWFIIFNCINKQNANEVDDDQCYDQANKLYDSYKLLSQCVDLNL